MAPVPALFSFFLTLVAVGALSAPASAQGIAIPENDDVHPFPGPGFSFGWSVLYPYTDRIIDVATGPGGAVLVCGNRNTGAVLKKLQPLSGDTVWTASLGGVLAEALVVDDEGASYVAGSYYPGGFPDVFLAKVDRHGTLVWSYTYDEYANNDEGLDVALGPDDSVVVIGHANGLQGANFFTAKLSRQGDVLWTAQVDGGPDSIIDSAVAVAVDPQGGVLVTGTSEGQASLFTPDVVTVKYSSDGALLWTQRHDGTAQSHDTPRDIAATSDGGCVVVGTTEASNSGADPLVLRYGPDGALHWLYDKGSNGGDSARAVVLDAAENVYVTGSTFSSKNGFDVLALKLHPSGQRAWQLGWDGGEGRGDGGHAIALDAHGRVLVAGHSYHWWTENDVATLVLDPQQGKVLASAFFDGPLSRTEAPLSIAAGPGGGVFVGGFGDADYYSEKALVLRYDYW
jgi:hypothetical protein